MPDATTMQRVIITIPPALLTQVEDAAAKLNFSRSRLIREALEQYLRINAGRSCVNNSKRAICVGLQRAVNLAEEFAASDTKRPCDPPRLSIWSLPMKRPCRRGEIYYANLDPIIGNEQGGRRPVLVIQNDTVISIVPNDHLARVDNGIRRTQSIPTEVRIAAGTVASRRHRPIRLDQIGAIEKSVLNVALASWMPGPWTDGSGD